MDAMNSGTRRERESERRSVPLHLAIRVGFMGTKREKKDRPRGHAPPPMLAATVKSEGGRAASQIATFHGLNDINSSIAKAVAMHG